MFSRHTLLTCLLPLLLPTVACTQEQKREVGELWSNNCASCHGEDLSGGLAPSLLDDQWTYGGSDEQLARSIRDGSPDGGMPPWAGSLSPAEIRSLVVFIRERRAATVSQPARASLDAPREAAGHRFVLQEIASGLDTPWSIAFLAPKTLLIAEKSGRLRLLEDGVVGPALPGTPTVLDMGQGGLMEVALHPQFNDNGWIYLAYSEATPGGGSRDGMTTLVRGRLRDGRWSDQELIYRAPPGTSRNARVHWGCRIAFDGDGHLFFSIGDRGAPDHAQQLDRPNGKIHRLFDDGRIPPDNPFVSTTGALPTIWSYGHRNPQGLVFRPTDGSLWSTEHGPRGGDELNLILPGRNYGWPRITHGINYNGTPVSDRVETPGMESPATHWTPSIAVCGIDFYQGDRFPLWRDALLVTALAGQELRLIRLDGSTVTSQETLLHGIGRVRDVASGPDGCIYLTLNGPGRILRLEPAKP